MNRAAVRSPQGWAIFSPTPSSHSLPPGPSDAPAAQLVQYLYRPARFLGKARKMHGTPFTLRLPGLQPIVIFDRPDAVKEVFTGPSDALHAGKANSLLRPFLGPHSVLVLDGEAHLRQRRLLLPPFRGERMKAYGTVMRDVTQTAMRGWGRLPMRTQTATQDITLKVILQTVFGMDDRSAREGELPRLMVQMLGHLDSPLSIVGFFQKDLGPWSPWGRFVRLRARVWELLMAEIADRRRQGRQDRDDVLSMLIDATHEDGSPMSDEEIRDELMTMLVAGHETTATALSWSLHRLTRHPRILHRIQRELDQVFPDGQVDPNRASELEYLLAFAKETLRVHPVIPGIGRVLQRPMRIGGFDLPTGVMVACSMILTHTLEDVWPDPARFDPERFLGKRVSPYEFFPFGGGVRRCIGEAFALHEIRIVLATILTSLRPVAVPGVRIRSVRRNITLSPSYGLPLRFVAR